MQSIDNFSTDFLNERNRKAAFILSIFLILAGCDTGDSNFLSSKGDGPQGNLDQKARDINLKITVDVNNQKGRRQGKSSGGPSSAGSRVADPAPSDSRAASTSSSPSPSQPGFQYNGSDEQEATDLLVKMNFLFYLGHKIDGKCWSYFSNSAKNSGFFSHINDFNWQAAAAFYSHDPKLYPFRQDRRTQLNTGKGFDGWWSPILVYLLKKGLFSKDKSDEYLKATIETEYVRNIIHHYDTGRSHVKWPGEPQFPWPQKPRKIPEDPLFGLEKLLKRNPKDFIRKDSKTFVVLFEFDNYRYSQEEWKQFADKYEDIYFVALSSRRGTAANHAYDSNSLKWIPCGYTHIARRLADYMREIAQK